MNRMDLHSSEKNYLGDSIIEINPFAYGYEQHGSLESIRSEMPTVEAIYEVLQYPGRKTHHNYRHPRKNHE